MTTTATVYPPFTMYKLVTAPGTRNSPPLPAVHLWETNLDGSLITGHVLTPEQALELGQGLIDAAVAATR